jgi:hypothetical protein
MLLSGLISRPLKLSNHIQTNEWKIPVTDPAWNQTTPFYELLSRLFTSGCAYPRFDPHSLRRLMDRTQGSDNRERSAAARILSLSYEHIPEIRDMFLLCLEGKLIDLRDDHLQPFAGPQLLLCLLKAMEVSLGSSKEVFYRLLRTAVVPLIGYRYLEILLSPIGAVFLKFMASCPEFGVEALCALQSNWPLSTRAASTARLAIGIFCGLNAQYSQLLGPSFLEFLAACLTSSDSLVVTAALGMSEMPAGHAFLMVNAADAITKLYPALHLLLGKVWLPTLRDKVLACIDTLEKANTAFFEAFTAREVDEPPPRPFPLPRWRNVAVLAAGRDGSAVPKGFLEQALSMPEEHGGISKIVSTAVRDKMSGAKVRRSAPVTPGRQSPFLPTPQFATPMRARLSRTLSSLPPPLPTMPLGRGLERDV